VNGHIRSKQEFVMSSHSFPRASVLTIALGLTALGSTLAPTGAYAHFGGGNFSGGFAGAMGSASRIGTGSVMKLPAAVGRGVARNSAVARLPVGKTSGKKIPTTSDIPRFFPPVARGPIDPRPPRRPPPVVNPGPIVVPVPVDGPVAVGGDVPVGAAVDGTVGQAVAGDCNCLAKQYLPDGSVLFKDLCTKESAIARNGAAAR
jgi:hypothetical protein